MSGTFCSLSFSTKLQKPKARNQWIKKVSRKHPKTGKNWQPSADDSVFSNHFVHGKPTDTDPIPSIDLGYNQPGMLAKNTKRAVPKERTTPLQKKVKLELKAQAKFSP